MCVCVVCMHCELDLLVPSGSKYTALMFAALNGHISLVRLLLKHGADKEMESSFQQKAVDIAGTVGREDIAKLLGYSKVTKPSPVTPWAQSIPDGKGTVADGALLHTCFIVTVFFRGS